MATLEEAFFTRLAADAGVAALVGSRIYPVTAAQGTQPGTAYITYERVAGVPYHTMNAPAGLRRARLSYLCHGGKYATARAIVAAVLASLDGFKGTLSTNVVVGACLSEEDAVDLEFDEAARVYTTVVDFSVQYRES